MLGRSFRRLAGQRVASAELVGGGEREKERSREGERVWDVLTCTLKFKHDGEQIINLWGW